MLTRDTVQELKFRALRKEILVDGVQQVWHVWNPDGNSQLVLLHGGSGSWTHWINNITALSQTRAVWALDIPGFGDSQLPPNALDVDDLVPFVMKGLNAINKGGGLDIIGFSFGGLLGGYLAAQGSTIIKSLILVGVPALGLTQKPLPLRGLRAEMTTSQIDAVHRHNLEIMMIYDSYLIDEVTLELQKENIARDRLRRRRIARSDVLVHLQRKWRCTVHGIWGEQDALYLGLLGAVREKLSNCDLRSFTVIPKAGHWVQFEQAQAFNTCVLSLLDREHC